MTEKTNVGQKISDSVTMLFPMIIALLGALGLAGVEAIQGQIMNIAYMVLGIASTFCSIWFNKSFKIGMFAGTK